MSSSSGRQPKVMDPLKVAVRTYTLALSLSLAPALLPLITSPKNRSFKRLYQVLRRELSPRGFAFAVTLAIGGGRVLDHVLKNHLPKDDINDSPSSFARLLRPVRRLSNYQQTLLSNILTSFVAVLLLTSRRRRANQIPTAPIPYTTPEPPARGSPTLDLTLLLLVRALDGHVQSLVQNYSKKTHNEPNDSKRQRLISKTTANLDVIIFWLACCRIMWCWFYEPDRLPKSYVKWITSLADMDQRIILALHAIREGRWKYSQPSPTCQTLLTQMASEMGFSPSLGDPAALPAYGGRVANTVWDSLGYTGRRGLGGLPCDIVHCGTAGNSCTGNAVMRGIRGFGQALLIYAPVHILPPLISNPSRLLTNPTPTLVSLFRSAAFLSTFISSYWFTVCCVRTLFIARFFPWISHDFWDGPQGCILAGSLVCGASIGIERGNRRGEIALYVLPRAIRACLPTKWVKSGSGTVRNLERLTFAWSLASLLTMAVHKPEVLRGISRWTLGYIMEGKKARSKKTTQEAPLEVDEAQDKEKAQNTNTRE